MKFLKTIRDYVKISGVAPIGRRYFIMNAFDGATTILGIVIGAYVAEITSQFWVIWSGLGATIAMGFSGFAGAYLTEEAERTRKLNTLEKSMLKKLKNTVVGRASRFAPLWTSIVDGVSPAIAAITCLTPFFLCSFGKCPIGFAFQLSIATTLSVMFLLGAFLGKVSGRSILFHGIKTLLVGVLLTLVFLTLKSFA